VSDIFISYSRKDQDFSERIVSALVNEGFEPWIDWKNIPKGEELGKEIEQGIEEADIFLFLVSPSSTQSEWCNKEIAHAVKNGKRILPVIILDIQLKNIHPEISKRNCISCIEGQTDFDKAISEISQTIRTDYEWVKYHTKLQIKALDWGWQRDEAQLLKGKELQYAEKQQSKIGPDKNPQLTSLQREFILASIDEEKRLNKRARFFRSVFIVIVITMLGALSVAMIAGLILYDKTPATVAVKGSVAEIRNRFNYRFFHVDVSSSITQYSFPVNLIPGQGYTIILGTGPDGAHPSTIFAYDMDGKLRWSFTANADIYNGPTANFSVTRIIVDQLLNNSQYQILFTTQKTDWFPSELVLLDANGKQLDYYWNSGFIYDVLLADFEGDGNKEIVVSAVNNDLGAVVVGDSAKHPSVVYILSPKQGFVGQTFPPIQDSNLPSGIEFNDWIAVLEPHTVQGIQLRIVPDAGQNLIEVLISPQGGFIYLNAEGKIQRVGLSDNWVSLYGQKSPADFICFLQGKDDNWRFSSEIGNESSCPWYVGQ
jgi:hypothetical protein